MEIKHTQKREEKYIEQLMGNIKHNRSLLLFQHLFYLLLLLPLVILFFGISNAVAFGKLVARIGCCCGCCECGRAAAAA